jgi:methyl-accepting chemotaxis protein
MTGMTMTGDDAAVGERRGPGRFFRDLPVSRKMLLVVAVLCVMLVAVGSVGVGQLGSVQNRARGLYRDSLQAIAHLGVVDSDLREVRLQVLTLATTPRGAAMQTIVAQIKTIDADMDRHWAAYTATDMRGREKARDTYDAALTTYRQIRDQRLIPLALAGKIQEFLTLRAQQTAPVAATMQAALKSLRDIEDATAAASMRSAQRAYSSARTLIVVLILLGVALGVALSLLVGRAIARALGLTIDVLEDMARGRLDRRVPVTSRDEVGRMNSALNTATERLAAVLSEISSNVAALTAEAGELSTVASGLQANADESSARARDASAASADITLNILTVASGSDEIGASIAEIARNTTEAATVAAQAVTDASQTEQTLRQLGESSDQISTVVKLITSIAEQTNLLALNATIEAARAGEAGKGFAVVANEVKDLAQETARATEDISGRVAAIQQDATAAMTAIAGITQVIGRINDAQSTIAAAVEEQSATTTEMSRNVNEVATRSREISDNVTSVAQIADHTTQGAASTAHASTRLAEIAATVQRSLAGLTY